MKKQARRSCPLNSPAESRACHLPASDLSTLPFTKKPVPRTNAFHIPLSAMRATATLFPRRRNQPLLLTGGILADFAYRDQDECEDVSEVGGDRLGITVFGLCASDRCGEVSEMGDDRLTSCPLFSPASESRAVIESCHERSSLRFEDMTCNSKSLKGQRCTENGAIVIHECLISSSSSTQSPSVIVPLRPLRTARHLPSGVRLRHANLDFHDESRPVVPLHLFHNVRL